MFIVEAMARVGCESNIWSVPGLNRNGWWEVFFHDPLERHGRIAGANGAVVFHVLLLVLALGGVLYGHSASRTEAAFQRHVDTAFEAIAYALSIQQEQQFLSSDTASSDCFAFWDSIPTLSVARLDWKQNADSSSIFSPPVSAKDISVELRLAYGTMGLFVYVERKDSTVISVGEWGIGPERVHLFFEARSAQALYADGTAFMALWCSQFTSRTVQLLQEYAWSEEPIGPDQVYIGALDTANADSGGCPSAGFAVKPPRRLYVYSYPNAEAGLGVLVRVSLWQEQGNRVAHEILLPWSFLGIDSTEREHGGDRMALSFSSQDMDLLDRNPSFLGWRNQADPFTRAVNPATGDTTSVDCWGDILFGEPLDSAVARAGVVRQPGRGRHTQAVAGDTHAEYFSVTGRKIDVTGSFSSSQPARGLVLVRAGESGALGRKTVLGQ